MRRIVEIHNRFQSDTDARHLLYAPVDTGMTYRTTRRYAFQYAGQKDALDRFIRTVLLDPVSEDLHDDARPRFEEFCFYLDISLKPGLLDLEKEAVTSYVRDQRESDWTLQDLSVGRRFYFMGAGTTPPEQMIKDMVNPVIHTWNVVYGTSSL